MVRINLLNPKKLADQHLIAEYNEILMLVAHIKKYPSLDGLPPKYCLGKGHMRFFKDKLLYLKERHELIKKEMAKRGFRISKTIDLNSFHKHNKNDWVPVDSDFEVIQKRIVTKLNLKPTYYRYYREKKPVEFLIRLIRS